MSTKEQTVALIVTMEDENLHTDNHPFCSDILCPCHESIDRENGGVDPYYAEYIRIPYQAGLLSRAEKERIYYGEHI